MVVAALVDENIFAFAALQSIITLAAVNRVVARTAEYHIILSIADNLQVVRNKRGVYPLDFAPVLDVANVEGFALVFFQNRNRRAVDDIRTLRWRGVVICLALRVNVSNYLIGGSFDRDFATADRKDNVLLFLLDLSRARRDFDSVFLSVVGD